MKKIHLHTKGTDDKKIHLHTKGTDDSKLYLTIDSLVNTLRQQNYSDDKIKKYLVKWVKEIIDEQ